MEISQTFVAFLEYMNFIRMRNVFTTTFWIWSLTRILLSKDFDPNVYKFLSCIRWRDARLNFLTRPSRASSRGSSKKSASKLTKSPHSNKTRLLQLSVLWAPEKFLIYQGFRLNMVMIVFSLDTDMYLLLVCGKLFFCKHLSLVVNK